MSRTFKQWVLFITACVAVGFMVSAMSASLGTTKDEVRNQLRMTVDFTVLPMVLPDGQTPSDTPPDTPVVTAPEPAQESTVPPEVIPPETSENKTEPSPEPATGDTGGHIKSISLEETPLGFTLKLVADGSISDTTYLNLTDPRRLVIDLRGNWQYRGKNVIRSDGAVKHVVIGEHSDRLRMVIHFRRLPAASVEPQFKANGNELFILVPLS
ncbi:MULTISPECIES: AMIN domain-containing protein [unclassified Pseudodesulfovibrio]|uniref:AMIN domain-containing protein n=1 Tax=unclassified Pseudodesulfovibrio TaxID=2661612 RepID=UPI000FEBA4B8|nr:MULTISPECIES: AMIN domain-containing protein [unclassified Pseudodesulfovibrio]MCJ2165450.1 AMIN domain-containing protein [Pseudodesulfovibrio sp. S3-i]RWU03200.1 AMIN domain-containing protein [Pseudodesulfovibrio sp. S3]